ncbi:MAG: hypothetical protein DI533_04620 [Cereibacter sphaeroides]|uniref:Uncharacterized protein n=1 Tax=Cereibacter sphaeroides TaxID=1063 RepID=A0A2W5SJP3_CERSP|nr:MAG: hypothetical protein DI533_04620 [Cereibacter sphaeroides]
MARWSLRWGNPNTSPPGGIRVKAAMLVQRGEPCPPEITELKVPGDGWALSWELVTQRPIKRWSRQARSRVRIRNLRIRLEKKFPLFAEAFIADELAARPDYFAAADVSERIAA